MPNVFAGLERLVESRQLQGRMELTDSGFNLWFDAPGCPPVCLPGTGTPSPHDDTARLLVRALDIAVAYEVSDDFPDWCDEQGLDAADPAELAYFKSLDAPLHALAAMLGCASLADLSVKVQMGQPLDGGA